MSEAGKEGPDFHRLGLVLRRRKWLLLAIVASIPLAVYAVSTQVAKTYEASTTLLVQPTSAGSVVFTQEAGAGGSAEQAATLTETTLVARRAARLLDQPPASAAELLDRVQAEATSPGDGKEAFVTIAAQAPSAARAARIANAFATGLARTRTRQAVESIDRTIATLRRVGKGKSEAAEEALQTQLQQLRGLKASQAGTTVVVDRATPADAPYSPRPLRNALLALIVALLIAAGLVPLVDRIDRRLREPGELEELLEPPLLATIPDAAFPGQPPDWHVREAFQTLRAGLTYFNVDRPLSTLVVTSPAQWEGKTTVAINLAIAYALDGQDTILVDADLRHPQVARRLGQEPAIGLEAVLAGERVVGDALLDVDAGGGRLRILPGAVQPPNPAALLGSQRMRSLLAELSERADVVVIDTPALLAVSDAMPLVNQAAGAVLVARMNVTTREAARRAEKVVKAAGGSVLGAVATGVRDGGVYGYYGYYSAPPEEAGKPRRAAPPSSSNGAGGEAPTPSAKSR